MTKCYFFSSDCSEELLERALTMTEDECEEEYQNNENFDVYRYSDIKDYEESHNNGGFASDCGIVRFF